MITKIIPRAAVYGLLLLTLISVGTALATSNSVPGTHAGRMTRAIDANALKPSQCAALNLTAIVTGSGDFQGTAASELIIGGPGADIIRGRGGTDCILGGGGNDDIRGGNGGDVCIGGPGTDTFTACETRIQ